VTSVVIDTGPDFRAQMVAVEAIEYATPWC
jgi:hypothetical protein